MYLVSLLSGSTKFAHIENNDTRLNVGLSYQAYPTKSDVVHRQGLVTTVKLYLIVNYYFHPNIEIIYYIFSYMVFEIVTTEH